MSEIGMPATEQANVATLSFLDFIDPGYVFKVSLTNALLVMLDSWEEAGGKQAMAYANKEAAHTEQLGVIYDWQSEQLYHHADEMDKVVTQLKLDEENGNADSEDYSMASLDVQLIATQSQADTSLGSGAAQVTNTNLGTINSSITSIRSTSESLTSSLAGLIEILKNVSSALQGMRG